MKQDALDNIYDYIEELRTKGTGIARYGCTDKSGNLLIKSDYVCCAAARSGPYLTADYFFLVWNGDPYSIKTEGAGTYSDRHAPERDRNTFEPGPHSDAWLEFILSPEFSPWKAIFFLTISTENTNGTSVPSGDRFTRVKLWGN